MGAQALGASYRDPSGFVYTRDGTLYRQVNRVFQERFRAFLDSGLYAELAERGLLVPHREAALGLAASRSCPNDHSYGYDTKPTRSGSSTATASGVAARPSGASRWGTSRRRSSSSA